MPSWGQILNEISQLAKTNQKAFDVIRQKYIKELFDYTKRNTIVYASRWTPGDAPPNLIAITDEDIQAFMEAVHGLKGDQLDLVLHTGGGSAEATDAIVSYLRQKFTHIRIIIPQAAMSAGTMLSCAADEIVMGKHSFIGPLIHNLFSKRLSASKLFRHMRLLNNLKKLKMKFLTIQSF
jgi:ClpP class serine protease